MRSEQEIDSIPRSAAAEEDPSDSSTIRYEYVKAVDYRTFKADGVFGGITPRGTIFLSLYTERNSIPSVTVHEVKDGRLGEELRDRRIDRDGYIREVQTGFIIGLDNAKALIDWLTLKTSELEALREKSSEQTK